uniref:Glycosyl transferase, family 9 n=1 Tax=Solibacter usitatus (strain Ellin6076) TaxID=234267 RepID=Q025H4_SOLUE
MDCVLDSLPRGSRVAILRLRSLGDCVLTTPALYILKRFRPDLHLAIFVEDRFREIFEGSPDLDQILAPDLPTLRRFRPQLCLNLHGGTRSTWMTELSGARYRAGFTHFRQQFVYNVRIPRAQEILGVERKVHTAEHLASAIFFLGAPAVEIPRAILVPSQPAAPLPVPTAIIHPLASAPEKTWPAENFLAVAKHLEQSGIEPIFIGAHADDLSPFARYQTIQGAPLSQIKNLLAAASLFIGNDSGPAHMAAAFGLPCAVIFSASDPDIWGPWRTAGEVVPAPASTDQVLDALHRLKAAA